MAVRTLFRKCRLRSGRGPAQLVGSAVGLCTVLSGCMTLGDHPVPPLATETPAPETKVAIVSPAPPAAVRPKRPVREAHKAPEPHIPRAKPAPLIDPQRLIGMDPDGVQKLLGTPARIRDDEMSREWVYASPGCSFRVMFYPNLNAASFHVLKYGGNNGNGDLLDISDICIRRILTARTNAAN